MIRRLFSRCIMLVLTLVIASCIVHRVDIVPVDVSAETPILVSSPVKAHLLDGSTAVFPKGVNVYDGKVQGKGERFDIGLENNRFVDEIALDRMGHDLNHLGNRAEMGLWYRENMGMTVSVWRDREFRKVGKIGDQGPITWSERAFALDAPEGNAVRIFPSTLRTLTTPI